MLNGDEHPNIMAGIREVLYRLPNEIFKVITENRPVFFFVLKAIGQKNEYKKEENESINLKDGFKIIVLHSYLNMAIADSIKGVIVHELAHAYLHSGYVAAVNEDEEADCKAIEWGFEKEIKTAKADSTIAEYYKVMKLG